jgi:hypothetical protein
MSTHLTTEELAAARAKYRGEIIPADALSVMDTETEALRASGIEHRALKPGAVAPDFMLPDAQGRCVRLQSLLRRGPVVLVFTEAIRSISSTAPMARSTCPCRPHFSSMAKA